MKHAGPATLARIAHLLEALRGRTVLRERRPGVFYLGSRAFLHFHDDPSGVFADVRLADEFVRLPVTRREEQLELLDRIDECLAVAECREAGKRRSQAKRRDGERPGRRRGVRANGGP
jgi:hypothetical protein